MGFLGTAHVQSMTKPEHIPNLSTWLRQATHPRLATHTHTHIHKCFSTFRVSTRGSVARNLGCERTCISLGNSLSSYPECLFNGFALTCGAISKGVSETTLPRCPSPPSRGSVLSLSPQIGSRFASFKRSKKSTSSHMLVSWAQSSKNSMRADRPSPHSEAHVPCCGAGFHRSAPKEIEHQTKAGIAVIENIASST